MMALVTKAARHAAISEVIGNNLVRSQTELGDLLGDRGITVSQGTLSKDLLELGATRIRNAEGQLVYAVPGEGGDRSATAGESQTFENKLARLCHEVMVAADASANLAVLRTPPGAAQYFASAIDKVGWSEILGTIAGDDTVLVITRHPDGGIALAERMLGLTRSESN